MSIDFADILDNIVIPQLHTVAEDAVLEQPGATTGPEYNPTPGTPVTYNVKIVNASFTVADKTGTLIKEGDRKYIMSPKGNPSPDLTGTLTVGSDVLQIINIERVTYQNVIMLWYLHCRK